MYLSFIFAKKLYFWSKTSLQLFVPHVRSTCWWAYQFVLLCLTIIIKVTKRKNIMSRTLTSKRKKIFRKLYFSFSKFFISYYLIWYEIMNQILHRKHEERLVSIVLFDRLSKLKSLDVFFINPNLIIGHKISVNLMLVTSNPSASVRLEPSLLSCSNFDCQLCNNSKNLGETFFL